MNRASGMPYALQSPDFCGRERELALLLDRVVGSRESTLVVGEFPCGKGTLLRELGQRLGAIGYQQSFIAAQTLPSGAAPPQFWARVLPQLGGEAVGACEYRDIERALYASAVGGPPVLMIDDMHTLVHLPGFASPDLWGTLRALTQAKALTLVCTSNVDLVALTDRTKGLTLGSPFFNAMREMVLGPLGEIEVARIVDRAIPGADAELRGWILDCSGGHARFVETLCSCLAERMSGGEPGGPRRELLRRALVRCRHELRHVFSGVWPLFPWEERWMMLRIAVTQRSAGELTCPPPPEELPRWGERERAFGELLEDCLTREEVKRLLSDVLERRPEALLPGDGASGGEFYAQAADLVIRRGLVPRFLERLRQWGPHRASDIDRLAALWGQATRLAPSAWQPLVTHCDRLLARGVLGRALRAPGWEITPALFYWWLLDQVQLLIGGYDLMQWLHVLQLGDRVSLAEGRLFLSLVQRHEASLAGGAHVLVEGVCT